ncbi:MAG: hypothetical protein ABI581_15050 [Sediminibacterium sp.]
MKTEIVALKRIILTGVYVILIFSILALIRSQNKQLLSKEQHKIQETAVSGAA